MANRTALLEHLGKHGSAGLETLPEPDSDLALPAGGRPEVRTFAQPDGTVHPWLYWIGPGKKDEVLIGAIPDRRGRAERAAGVGSDWWPA